MCIFVLYMDVHDCGPTEGAYGAPWSVRASAQMPGRAVGCRGGQWWSECHDLPGEASLKGCPRGTDMPAATE